MIVVLGVSYHGLGGSIQEYNLGVEVFFEEILLVLAHHVHTVAQFQDTVDIRQLLEHDSLRRVDHHDAQDARQRQHDRYIDSDNAFFGQERLK